MISRAILEECGFGFRQQWIKVWVGVGMNLGVGYLYVCIKMQSAKSPIVSYKPPPLCIVVWVRAYGSHVLVRLT